MEDGDGDEDDERGLSYCDCHVVDMAGSRLSFRCLETKDGSQTIGKLSRSFDGGITGSKEGRLRPYSPR
jgi:hypothetical protein